MKRLIGLAVAGVVFFTATAQQVNMGGNVPLHQSFYTKEHTKDRKPIPYPFVRQSDVMWSRKIERNIPLREKMNHPMYFPTTELGDGRMNLTSALLYASEQGGIPLFDPMDEKNAIPMSKEQIQTNLGAGMDTVVIVDDEGRESKSVVPRNVNFGEVKQYLLREEWFFDKQRSLLEARIVSLTPVREYYREGDNEKTDVLKKKLFAAFYPAVRSTLSRIEVFNMVNDAERKSFDDIFQKRFFSSFIVRESNVMADRGINEYREGIYTMYEAEKIKNWIFDFEQDLWEY